MIEFRIARMFHLRESIEILVGTSDLESRRPPEFPMPCSGQDVRPFDNLKKKIAEVLGPGLFVEFPPESHGRRDNIVLEHPVQSVATGHLEAMVVLGDLPHHPEHPSIPVEADRLAVNPSYPHVPPHFEFFAGQF